MTLEDADGAMLARIGDGSDLVAQARGWCAINSGSRNLEGLAALAGPLADALARLPGHVERIALGETREIADDGTVRAAPNGEALRLTVRPDAPTQVALTGHYDTVYPAASSFTQVAMCDGVLNGPGIADMKGGIAVLLAALGALERHPRGAALGYTVLLSPDEETGSLASAALLAELGAKAQVGFTYEPALADGRLVSARKGSGNFHVRVAGRAAHAGRDFAQGRNAVVVAAGIAKALDRLNGGREGVTVNIARIDGGGPLNMVPDVAVLRFNARLPDAAAEAWLMDGVAEALSGAARDGISVALHGGITRPPKPFGAAQRQLFAAVARLGALIGQPLAWAPSGGVCEGNNLFAAGLPGVDTLGVRGGDIHSPREFAIPASFAERARLSALLLAKLADGTIDGRALRRTLAEEACEPLASPA